MFEAVQLPGARAVYELLAPDEQRAVDQRIGWIERLPEIGAGRRLIIGIPPRILSVFDDGLWRIAYRVVDDRFIEVWAIRRVG